MSDGPTRPDLGPLPKLPAATVGPCERCGAELRFDGDRWVDRGGHDHCSGIHSGLHVVEAWRPEPMERHLITLPPGLWAQMAAKARARGSAVSTEIQRWAQSWVKRP